MKTNGNSDVRIQAVTVHEALRAAEELLQKYDFEDARFEARCLVEHCLGLSRGKLLLAGREQVEMDQLQALEQAVRRRISREPLQYIFGEWEFYSLPFQVNENVLIPRQDTEVLVEEALRLIKPVSNPNVLDLCTGSGCIAVALGKTRKDANIAGVDLSVEAVRLAKHNAHLNNVCNCRFFTADVREAPPFDMNFDLVVSNPPYIRTGELANLAPELKSEPAAALDGGKDGLLFYRAIALHWIKAMQPGSFVALEIGYDQYDVVAEMLQAAGVGDIRPVTDYNKVRRIIAGKVN